MGQFNGKDDLMPEIVALLTDIFTTPVQVGNEDERNTTLNLTLTQPPVVLSGERIVYGYFDAGVSGQEIMVKNRHTKLEVFKGDRDNHGLYKNLFFYIKIPFKSDSAYLILQKKSRFGIKSAFTTLLKKWIKQRGYDDSYIGVNSVLNGALFNKMLSYGKLKKVNFIVNHIPNHIEDYIQNNENPSLRDGYMTTTIESKNGLSDSWTNFAKAQYLKEDRKTLVEFDGDEKEYDEIQFELELNGRKKTFYANNKGKTIPDIDVTHEIEKDQKTGEPLLGSILKKCAEIVEDTFEIKPNVESY